ncbi:MAG: hypothetical protein OEU91_04365 [Gammaproteobacteria bacterium]|nr:hypothetical protein [Gammaproteobacteria bacterium]
MDNREPTSVEDFRSTLARCGKDYIQAGHSGSESAYIRFLGIFDGCPIIRDATVHALKYRHDAGEHASTSRQRQYIEIAPQGFPLRCITIGLNIAAIDTPALLKTIVMVRKYKRLHTGRHEFGAAARQGDD